MRKHLRRDATFALGLVKRHGMFMELAGQAAADITNFQQHLFGRLQLSSHDDMSSDSDEDYEDDEDFQGDMNEGQLGGERKGQPKKKKDKTPKHVIYVVIEKERNDWVVIEKTDINKVGMTGNLSARIQEYLNGNSRYLEKYDVLPVIILERIPLVLDRMLLDVLKSFLDKVIEDDLVPAGLREFYTNIRHRSWHR